MATPAELAKYDKKRVNPLATLPKKVAKAIENQQLGPSFRASRLTPIPPSSVTVPAPTPPEIGPALAPTFDNAVDPTAGGRLQRPISQPPPSSVTIPAPTPREIGPALAPTFDNAVDPTAGGRLQRPISQPGEVTAPLQATTPAGDAADMAGYTGNTVRAAAEGAANFMMGEGTFNASFRPPAQTMNTPDQFLPNDPNAAPGAVFPPEVQDTPAAAAVAAPVQGVGRVFTDQANAGQFPGGVVVTQDAAGNNIYTQDGKTIDLKAAIAAEGPRQPYAGGSEFQAFDRDPGSGGLRTVDGAVIAGQGGNARILDSGVGFRQLASGAIAPNAPGAPPPAAGGGGTGLSPEGQGNLAMLQRGLPQVQAAYDAAVASGNQDEISRARLALLSQKADIAKVSMGDRLSTNRFDFEREMLRDWPTGNSPEAVIQRRRIASAINQNRTANQKLSIDQLNAEANYRNAEGGGRDSAQVRLDNANAALKENELVNRGLGVDFKSAMDEAGNLIAGGIITWPRHNLSVSAEDWSQVQAASSPGGEIYNAIAAQNPGADPESILETAMHAAMRKYGTPTSEG